MHVGICRLTLLASHCHSLKEKRAVIRTLKDRVRSRFHLPVSEVGAQNTWQRVVLGFAVVGSDYQQVDTYMAEIIRFIERAGIAELSGVEREVLSYGDEPMGSAAALDAGLPNAGIEDAGLDASWIPASWREPENLAPESHPPGSHDDAPDEAEGMREPGPARRREGA